MQCVAENAMKKLYIIRMQIEKKIVENERERERESEENERTKMTKTKIHMQTFVLYISICSNK